jgi:hypothetical protein
MDLPIEFLPGMYLIEPGRNLFDAQVSIDTSRGSLARYAKSGHQDRILRNIEVKRKIEGAYGELSRLLAEMHKKQSFAVDAIVCYSRGEEARIQCETCESKAGPFKKCVVFRGEFYDKCANCTYLGPKLCCIDDDMLFITSDPETAASRMDQQGKSNMVCPRAVCYLRWICRTGAAARAC